MYSIVYLVWQDRHQWCSGNINAFQAFALGSIPGWCKDIFLHLFIQTHPSLVHHHNGLISNFLGSLAKYLYLHLMHLFSQPSINWCSKISIYCTYTANSTQTKSMDTLTFDPQKYTLLFLNPPSLCAHWPPNQNVPWNFLGKGVLYQLTTLHATKSGKY